MQESLKPQAKRRRPKYAYLRTLQLEGLAANTAAQAANVGLESSAKTVALWLYIATGSRARCSCPRRQDLVAGPTDVNETLYHA